MGTLIKLPLEGGKDVYLNTAMIVRIDPVDADHCRVHHIGDADGPLVTLPMEAVAQEVHKEEVYWRNRR
jgi:hypothetical protein